MILWAGGDARDARVHEAAAPGENSDRSSSCSCCICSLHDEKLQLHFFFNLLWEQHVTVGVVGGSDLVKITEQLGNTGD